MCAWWMSCCSCSRRWGLVTMRSHWASAAAKSNLIGALSPFANVTTSKGSIRCISSTRTWIVDRKDGLSKLKPIEVLIQDVCH